MGPAFVELSPRVGAVRLRPVVAASVAGAGADGVLNACRALRWAVEGSWVAKRAAGEWAAGRHPEWGEVVAGALAGYARGRSVGGDSGREFVGWVRGRLKT